MRSSLKATGKVCLGAVCIVQCVLRHSLLQKFEDDITYWLNRDRNGHDYYDYYQRHYDEDSAIGPRSPHSFRHGASVNYDDY